MVTNLSDELRVFDLSEVNSGSGMNVLCLEVPLLIFLIDCNVQT